MKGPEDNSEQECTRMWLTEQILECAGIKKIAVIGNWVEFVDGTLLFKPPTAVSGYNAIPDQYQGLIPIARTAAACFVSCRKSNKQTGRLFAQNFSWRCNTQVLMPYGHAHSRLPLTDAVYKHVPAGLVCAGRKRFVVSHVGRHKHWTHNLQKFSTIEIFWQTHTQIHTYKHTALHRQNHRQARAVAQEQLEMKHTTRDAREGVLLFFLQLLLLSLHMHIRVCVCVNVCLRCPSVLLVFVSQVFNKKLLNSLCSLFVLLAAASVRERDREWWSWRVCMCVCVSVFTSNNCGN